MANPIAFKPAPVNPKHELQRRLDAAPTQHAEALLVAYDLLQAAHDKGLLDMANGVVRSKDFILGKIAEYAKTPEGINGIRNLLEAAKILVNINPDILDGLSRALVTANAEHRREEKPPGLIALARRATSEDSRRGLSFVTLLLAALGRSMKE